MQICAAGQDQQDKLAAIRSNFPVELPDDSGNHFPGVGKISSLVGQEGAPFVPVMPQNLLAIPVAKLANLVLLPDVETAVAIEELRGAPPRVRRRIWHNRPAWSRSK